MVHSKADIDLNNIEAVFTTFELGQTIRKLPGVDEANIEAAVNSLKAIIVHTIDQSMLFPLDEERCLCASRDYAEFASFLFGLLQKLPMGFKRVTVITFNYDIGAEVGFERLEGRDLPYGYFFNEKSVVGNGVKLLKLHGSIDWGQDLDSKEIVPIAVDSLLSNFGIVTDQTLTHHTLPVGASFAKLKSFAPIPVIVPPGLFKAEYQGSIGNVWQEAAKELESAKEIIVIGYSLPETDFFFRYLYALGTVGQTILRRFAVFNPDESGDVEGRFRSLLGSGAIGRFKYHPETFESAIQVMRQWYLPHDWMRHFASILFTLLLRRSVDESRDLLDIHQV